MKTILLLGAGKSSAVLIEHLYGKGEHENFRLVVADAQPQLAEARLQPVYPHPIIALDVNGDARQELIGNCDLVISLLPPHLHLSVAQDCLALNKHFLSASYIDGPMRLLNEEAKERGLLFLGEMGLDPGIDHMSAMQLFAELRQQGAGILSFHSHCGGLVAPESDDNPWHYKISWNARNVVLSGKNGARYLEQGQVRELEHTQLFDPSRTVDIPGLGRYAWYPNRDSIPYISLYGLTGIHDFVRTTLRHPDFCFGWNNIIQLGLTDEKIPIQTNGLTVRDFFRQHLAANDFSGWLKRTLNARFEEVKDILEQTMQLMEAEGEAREQAEVQGRPFDPNMMIVDTNGRLKDIDLQSLKTDAATIVMRKMHEANLSLKLLFHLGLDSSDRIDLGLCTAADVMTRLLETRLSLQPSDKDMIVMLHEIGYELQGQRRLRRAALVVKGENNVHTAMAKTVGLPLAIAARLVLDGKIGATGVQVPTIPGIYEPVLRELREHGIRFEETDERVS